LTYAGDGILVARRASVTLSRHGHRTPTLERDVEVDPGLERYTPSMITATLLASVLAVAPQPQPPPPFEVADVEFEQTPDTAQLTAFDSDGEVVGELAVWRDSTGQPMLAATFPDGLYMFVSLDNDAAIVDTEDGEEVAARVDEIMAALPEGATAGSSQDVAECLGYAGLVVAGCMVHPVICAGEMYFAACHCLPKFVDKWKNEEC
jgi:hypothetical protein